MFTCGICGLPFHTGGVVSIRDTGGRRRRVFACARCAGIVVHVQTTDAARETIRRRTSRSVHLDG